MLELSRAVVRLEPGSTSGAKLEAALLPAVLQQTHVVVMFTSIFLARRVKRIVLYIFSGIWL